MPVAFAGVLDRSPALSTAMMTIAVNTGRAVARVPVRSASAGPRPQPQWRPASKTHPNVPSQLTCSLSDLGRP
jgi:hypothetical protein